MAGIPVVCAVALCEGTVFLAKRKEGGPHGGLWEFPGGKIEAGESAERALAREIQEEHGVEIVLGEKLLAITDGRIELLPFLVEFRRPPQCLEAQAIQWLPLHEAQELPMPPCDRRILLRLIDRQSRYTAPVTST